MSTLALIDADGTARRAELRNDDALDRPAAPLQSRELFAAAHVVPRAHADNVPGAPADIDWDATLAFRRNLYSWGLGVADAMDTAQRNMGLDAAATRELITRSAEVARECGGRLAVGVNTDHEDATSLTLEAITTAYLTQLEHAEANGTIPVLMASRHLARTATGPNDYRTVYGAVLARAEQPVVLHWLGAAFDPELATYFGSADWQVAAAVLLDIIEAHPDRVAGVKMSLLDADAERSVRARLPEGVRMYTGDDFHYVDLIGGTNPSGAADGYSDALLGAFAAVAPVASSAVQALDRGDTAAYESLLRPTEALSRQVFAAPTYFYKTGVAFLAWLNGHQPAFQMIGGLHAARSLPHLSRIVELANESRALERPELAQQRWHGMLALNGVDV